MTKATLTLGSGTVVSIEGSVEDIKELLEKFSEDLRPSTDRKVPAQKVTPKKSNNVPKKVRKQGGPADLIRELIKEDYFKAEKRSLLDIQKKLEERGYIYAQNSLSTPARRLTRKQELRRLKEGKNWVYTT